MRPAARRPDPSRDRPRRWPRPPLQLGPLLLGISILVAEVGVSRARSPGGPPASGEPPDPGRRHLATAAQRLQECLSSANRSQCLGSGSDGSGCSALLRLRRHRLKHCYEINLWYTLERSRRIGGAGRCEESRLERHVASVDARDKEVGIMYESFVSILDRYDCDERYSMMHNCSSCKEAYRRWLCAVYMPYYGERAGAGRLRPCRAVCHRVQQVCPHLLPAERPGNSQQYAGEPSFYCEDKHIPEIVPLSTGRQYGASDCCFQPGCAGSAECAGSAACPARRPAEPPQPQRSAASAVRPWTMRRRRRRTLPARTGHPVASAASAAALGSAAAAAVVVAAVAATAVLGAAVSSSARGRHRARTRYALSSDA